MGVRLTGDWDRMLDIAPRAKRAITQATKAEAEFIADKLREGIATGAPAGNVLAPLHPLTEAMKGSPIPLGGMERFVQLKQSGPFAFFVGYVDPDGIRIGLIHEEGRTWSQTWTARQRGWFFAQMARFGLLDPHAARAHPPPTGDTHTHVIPARPHVAPVAERYLPEARERLGQNVIRLTLGR